jgi:hypothetical protein
MPKSTKDYGVPVAVRIPTALLNKLLSKHPDRRELSKVFRLLLQRYADGKIFGVKVEAGSQ